MPWTADINAGIKEVLSGSPSRPRIHTEYMDTKRNPTADYLAMVAEPMLRFKLRDEPYDLILVSDNDALSFDLKNRDTLFRGTPIVFCGINNFQPALLAGQADITGIAENVQIRETVALMLQLHPATRNIFVVGNSDDLTAQILSQQPLRWSMNFIPRSNLPFGII